jgi:hypothetical protein
MAGKCSGHSAPTVARSLLSHARDRLVQLRSRHLSSEVYMPPALPVRVRREFLKEEGALM